MSRERNSRRYDSTLSISPLPSTRDEDFESKMILYLKGLIQKKYPLRNVPAHTSRDMKEYVHHRTLTDILDEIERSEYAGTITSQERREYILSHIPVNIQ